jgi:type VI secretion system protein ImpF
MAPKDEKRPLASSILDRLMDEEPGNRKEQPRSVGQQLRELKSGLRRDLESLLNTRWRCRVWPPELDQLDVSLVNYGIPDFTGVNMSVPAERENLRIVIQRAIARFEPRLKNVVVTVMPNADPFDRVLRFRINGIMRAEPAPEPVTFDSELEPSTTAIEIKALR